MKKLLGGLFGLSFLGTLILLTPASSHATARTIPGRGCSSENGYIYCAFPGGDDFMATNFAVAYFDFSLGATGSVGVEVDKRTASNATTYADATVFSDLAKGSYDKGLTLGNTKKSPSHWDYTWVRISGPASMSLMGVAIWSN